MIGALVKCQTLAAMVHVQTQHEAKLTACFFIVWELFLWNSALEAMHWQGLSMGYVSANHRLRIREKVEWMVYHSDHVSSSETSICNHSFSEYEWWGFFTKIIWMYRFGKFTNIWNCVCRQYCTYHQCCPALSCMVTPVSYCS